MIKEEALNFYEWLNDLYRNPFRLLLVLLSLFISFGFLIGHKDFAYIGIPLKFINSSSIQFQETKLFIFEIYLTAFGLITLLSLRNHPQKLLSGLSSRFGLVFCFLFVVGNILFIYSLIQDPKILVIRNAAFVWYLTLPLMVYLSPMTLNDLEKIFALTFILSLCVLVRGIYIINTTESYSLPWASAIGVGGILYYGFSRVGFASTIVLALIGGCLGHSLGTSVQRTTIVSTIVSLAVIFFLSKGVRGIALKRLWIFATAMGIVYCVAEYNIDRYKVLSALNLLDSEQLQEGNKNAQNSRIWIKSQEVAPGVEAFRYYMWVDALNLFLNKPLAGIGFNEQVVYRIYNIDKTFYPNNGTWGALEGKPPISGPHNSYLNALARLGIVGALFFVLHGWTFFLLFKSNFYTAAFAVVGQVIYAFFNVGLEGPFRSFWVLLALGMALKIAQKNSTLEIRK